MIPLKIHGNLKRISLGVKKNFKNLRKLGLLVTKRNTLSFRKKQTEIKRKYPHIL